MRLLMIPLCLALLAAPASADRVVTIRATKQMTYSPDHLTVMPGETITFKIANDSMVDHNFVLVLPGKAKDAAAAGLSAGFDAGYIPKSKDVVAHSSVITPGSSGDVTLVAPKEPGDYPFLCTFPGHGKMRGVLTVTSSQ